VSLSIDAMAVDVARVARHSLELVEEKYARDSLIGYTERMNPAYHPSPVHMRIAGFLERAIKEPGFRGIMVIPPRFGKSELGSVSLPGFYLGKYPDRQMIAASHTAALANDFSRQARNRVEEWDYPFPEVKVASDAGAVQQWEVVGGSETKVRGKYVAVGVGGSPTGKGAHVLVIDDAVKNQQEADSEIVRERTWEWFKGTALTRLMPDGAVMVIGTRWHWDDLIGRILKEDQDEGRWEVLHFPAILPDGSSLDPIRWPVAALEERRREVGSRVWQAQYMGEPTEHRGSMIKRDWFPLYTSLPPGILYNIQSWDTAFKSGQENDYSAGHTYAVGVQGLYQVGRVHKQLEFPDLCREVIREYEAFLPRYVLIEDAGSGQSLLQYLRLNTKIPVIPVSPAGSSKVKRVADATPHLEAGRVKLPEWGPWTEDVLNEYVAFPLGRNDDEVDAMTQAVMREYGNPEIPELISESYMGYDEEED
jgi:predicted phage terminase large subunit-like protein